MANGGRNKTTYGKKKKSSKKNKMYFHKVGFLMCNRVIQQIIKKLGFKCQQMIKDTFQLTQNKSY